MKRRWFAGAIALAVLGVSALPALGNETKIRVTVESSYQLTIPAKTDIFYGQTSTPLNGILKVTGNVLPDEAVQVTASAGALHNDMKNADLPYSLVTLKDGQPFVSAIWDEEELRDGLNGGAGKTLELSISITKENWNQAAAGTYEGTVTFTAGLLKNMQP